MRKLFKTIQRYDSYSHVLRMMTQLFSGQREAVEHAEATGHFNFQCTVMSDEAFTSLESSLRAFNSI